MLGTVGNPIKYKIHSPFLTAKRLHLGKQPMHSGELNKALQDIIDTPEHTVSAIGSRRRESPRTLGQGQGLPPDAS